MTEVNLRAPPVRRVPRAPIPDVHRRGADAEEGRVNLRTPCPTRAKEDDRNER